MKREFSFCYYGQDEHGMHSGIVTNLQMMRSQVGRFRKPMTGCTKKFEATDKPALWEAVQEYIMDYPGGWDATVIINKVVHNIPGHRRCEDVIRNRDD